MPPKKQAHQSNAEARLGEFLCKFCGHKGKSTRGGYKKHLNMSEKCRVAREKKSTISEEIPEETHSDDFGADSTLPNETMDVSYEDTAETAWYEQLGPGKRERITIMVLIDLLILQKSV
jgi:hypothetical protein